MCNSPGVGEVVDASAAFECHVDRTGQEISKNTDTDGRGGKRGVMKGVGGRVGGGGCGRGGGGGDNNNDNYNDDDSDAGGQVSVWLRGGAAHPLGIDTMRL